MIDCVGLDGQRVTVPLDTLNFRLSVYGVALAKKKKVLLVKGHTSQKLWYPGGGVNVGEPLEKTLIREFLEETGISIAVKKMLTLREEFFYHNVWNKAFHSIRIYYLCNPLSMDLVDDKDVIDGESEKPRWLSVENLSRNDFDQAYGLDILNQAINA